MDLARIGPEGMADGVGRGKRNREGIGMRPLAEMQLPDAFEGERHGERVHPWVRRDAPGDDVGSREAMREHEILAAVLERLAVRAGAHCQGRGRVRD
ncbi:MAG TPA: hypothetical protein VMT45_04980 [Thermoanaerobaculaceae bacterium]|nr:hypothetical protein [Thermoanaerobaculaceae bacterium]